MHVSLINEHGIVTTNPAQHAPEALQVPEWAERAAWAVVGALVLNGAVGIALLAVLLQGVV